MGTIVWSPETRPELVSVRQTSASPPTRPSVQSPTPSPLTTWPLGQSPRAATPAWVPRYGVSPLPAADLSLLKRVQRPIRPRQTSSTSPDMLVNAWPAGQRALAADPPAPSISLVVWASNDIGTSSNTLAAIEAGVVGRKTRRREGAVGMGLRTKARSRFMSCASSCLPLCKRQPSAQWRAGAWHPQWVNEPSPEIGLVSPAAASQRRSPAAD